MPEKLSQGRTMHPDANWRKKAQAARENDAPEPPGMEDLVQLLWRQGFGPVATARMLDWYCSSHPHTIKSSLPIKADQD